MTDSSFLGAFARIFPVDTPDQLAVAFHAHRLTQVQLNLNTFGLPTIPTPSDVGDAELAYIGKTLTGSGLSLWGISATYNTAHPDPQFRAEHTRRAADFIGRLGATGAPVATLCSGSRHPENMWGFAPDTESESAWQDFRASLDELLTAAETSGVLLAIEPEPANTVLDVDRALRLQRELGTDAERIGFILDPANLISRVAPGDHAWTLERAFDELGASAICVHAKDTVPWSATLEGRGVVDYDLVARLYSSLPARVPFIIQDTTEPQVDGVVRLLEQALSRVAA